MLPPMTNMPAPGGMSGGMFNPGHGMGLMPPQGGFSGGMFNPGGTPGMGLMPPQGGFSGGMFNPQGGPQNILDLIKRALQGNFQSSGNFAPAMAQQQPQPIPRQFSPQDLQQLLMRGMGGYDPMQQNQQAFAGALTGPLGPMQGGGGFAPFQIPSHGTDLNGVFGSMMGGNGFSSTGVPQGQPNGGMMGRRF